jgi:hypothetical protein
VDDEIYDRKSDSLSALAVKDPCALLAAVLLGLAVLQALRGNVLVPALSLVFHALALYRRGAAVAE